MRNEQPIRKKKNKHFHLPQNRNKLIPTKTELLKCSLPLYSNTRPASPPLSPNALCKGFETAYKSIAGQIEF